MSLRDEILAFRNQVCQRIRFRSKDLPPKFFPDEVGELLILEIENLKVPVITASERSSYLTGAKSWQPGLSLWDVENQAILDALRFHGGNKTHTARALKISLRGLHRRLECMPPTLPERLLEG